MSVWWHIHRDDFIPEDDTVRGRITGTGKANRVQTFETLERISTLIPPGEFLCTLDYWHNGKMPAYEIQWPWDKDGDGRPDRDRLLIHPANAIRNKGGEYLLLGCVALGERRLDNFWEAAKKPEEKIHPLAQGLPGITSSRKSIKAFMLANEGLKEFMLKITEGPR